MAKLRGVVTAAVLAMAVAAHADPDAKTLEQAHAHYKQGKAFLDAKVYDKAIEEFEVAYKLAPFPELLFNEGQAYRLANQPDKAITAYQEFLTSSPDGQLADEARTHVAELTKVVNDRRAAATAEQNKDAAEAARHQEEARQNAVFQQQEAAYQADQSRRNRLAHARHVGTGLAIGGAAGILGGIGIIVADQDNGPIVVGAGVVTLGFVLGLIGVIDIAAGSDNQPPVARPLAPSSSKSVSWTFHF